MTAPIINNTRNLGDWEYQKFRSDGTGKPAISVLNGNDQPIATEATLAKTVGFDLNSDITTDISTPGIVIETDGVRTLTTDYTTSTITEIWT